jgi:molecular chaperone DnaJ
MFFGGGRRRGPGRGRDLRVDLNMTLEQAASGLETTIEVPRTESCPTCHGSGARTGTSPTVCSNCRGSGQVTRAQNTPFGQMITSTTCPACGGRGQTIANPCSECAGTGLVRRTRKISVKIPPGVEDGQHLKLRGQGDAAPPGGEAGDLYVFLNILPHPQFQRSDSDLLYEMPISITQAALGFEAEVPTLNGKAILKIPPATQTGSIFRVRGKGMPRLHGVGSGDLHIKVKVTTPAALTSRQRQLMEELAAEFGETRTTSPPPKQPPKGDKGIINKIVDEVKSSLDQLS